MVIYFNKVCRHWLMQFFFLHGCCTSFTRIIPHTRSRSVLLVREGINGGSRTWMLKPQRQSLATNNHVIPPNNIKYENTHHDTTTRTKIEKESVNPQSRRAALERFTTRRSTAMLALLLWGGGVLAPPDVASYDKAYPLELVRPELSAGGSIQDGRERALQRIREQEAKRVSPLELGPGYKPLSSILWGAVLWLWSGSRSNPVITPLANVIYDPEKEPWLQDRNENLFADVPPSLYAIVALVFITAGALVDTLLVTLSEGDRNVALQLAGVSLISGAALELGRIASGEKKLTRAESDRSNQLEQEFAEFAQNRLKVAGSGAGTSSNVHRSEVVQAFRRYFAKYRVADSPDYPLGDLEIEQLLRAWTKRQQEEQQPGSSKIQMSQAGFYSGLEINRDADVFKPQQR